MKIGSSKESFIALNMIVIKKSHDDLGEVGGIAKIANLASANFSFSINAESYSASQSSCISVAFLQQLPCA